MSRINNSFSLVGHLGVAPEVHKIPTGAEVARLSLGVNSGYKDKTTGQRVEKTDWLDLVVYVPGLIDLVRKYTEAGSQIAVRGFLRKAVWDSKDRKDEKGQPAKDSRIELIVDEIQLLSGPRREESAAPAKAAAPVPGNAFADIDF